MIRARLTGFYLCATTIAALAVAAPVVAQEDVWSRPTLNFMGIPGILDMPTGHAMRDADLSVSFSGFDKTARGTLHFQITPRLSGVFRYAYIDNYNGRGDYYDRSFDLRYQLADEGIYRPAVAFGLQDFGGTGVYAGEYVVASKTFGRLRATGGIGWGRFGSFNGFRNPLSVFASYLEDRPAQEGVINETGRLDSGNWFRGDAAFFGGVQYAATDRLVLSAEYSSDDYVGETDRIGFERNSPLNVGFTYRFRNGFDVTGAYLYGSTAAVMLNYTFNAKTPNRFPGGIDGGVPQVAVRPQSNINDLGWTLDAAAEPSARASLDQLLDAEGYELEALKLEARRVQVRFRVPPYTSSAQAVGRISRLMSNVLPASVEEFVLIPVTENGIAASRILLRRSDLEDLEYAPDGSWQSFARAEISDAHPVESGFRYPDETFSKFDWRVGPYANTLLFDPNNPVRFDIGVQAQARYEPTPGLVFDGLIRKRLGGDPGDVRPSNSEIRKVRSDVGLYAEQGDLAVSKLTVARYFRPGKDLYGRVTAGYLEQMYGGLSAEVLWKPVDSRLAIGVEANYAQQRDFDQRFGFQDYGTMTGHVSAYLERGNGFHYQLDMGRYLAQDWGSTLTVTREFKNGIRLGAFATLTTVSFDDFGEGSFDKGFSIEIPVSTLLGRPSTQSLQRTVRPVLRDGGARLEVDGRLYESVRDFHQPGLQDQWGRFWR